MSKKLPYFQWYPADAASDEAYSCMTHEEIGLFHLALNFSWINDGLPGQCERIALALRAPQEVFERSWPAVSKCFRPDEKGRLRNARQEEERDFANAKSKKAKESADTRWAKTKEHDGMRTHSERIAQAMPRAYDSASVSSYEVLKEKNNVVKIDSEFADWFESVWARHPLRRDKTLAEQAAVDHFRRGLLVFAEFDRVHKLWCNTVAWTEKSGNFAPRLANWITDGAYKFPPVQEVKTEKPKSRRAVDFI